MLLTSVAVARRYFPLFHLTKERGPFFPHCHLFIHLSLSHNWPPPPLFLPFQKALSVLFLAPLHSTQLVPVPLPFPGSMYRTCVPVQCILDDISVNFNVSQWVRVHCTVLLLGRGSQTVFMYSILQVSAYVCQYAT